jgi:hypothetical protein
MAAPRNGETQDERSVMIDVACRWVGSKWRSILADMLEGNDTWLPWLVLWNTGSHYGARGYLVEPGPTDLRAVAADMRNQYGVPSVSVAKINLAGKDRERREGHLVEYARMSAEQAAKWEDRYPMTDGGEADWLN